MTIIISTTITTQHRTAQNDQLCHVNNSITKTLHKDPAHIDLNMHTLVDVPAECQRTHLPGSMSRGQFLFGGNNMDELQEQKK